MIELASSTNRGICTSVFAFSVKNSALSAPAAHMLFTNNKINDVFQVFSLEINYTKF